MIELFLSDLMDSAEERMKVAQYLLLDNQEALRQRLARLWGVYHWAQLPRTWSESGDDISRKGGESDNITWGP